MALYEPDFDGEDASVNVLIINDSDFPLPEYKTLGSAGMDLQASISEDILIKPQTSAIIDTKIRVALPSEYEFQIRSRSGLAAKHNVFVLNSPGTIDSDYRGTIGIILFNAGSVSFQVKNGDRIAQMVLQKVPIVNWIAVDNFDETERGSGGFGSTGV